MPNMKSLSLSVQKLQRRLKLTTDRQTDRQTDRTKTICPRSFDPGAKKWLRMMNDERTLIGKTSILRSNR